MKSEMHFLALYVELTYFLIKEMKAVIYEKSWVKQKFIAILIDSLELKSVLKIWITNSIGINIDNN